MCGWVGGGGVMCGCNVCVYCMYAYMRVCVGEYSVRHPHIDKIREKRQLKKNRQIDYILKK